MRHIIYQGVRLRDVPRWVEYIAADSNGEIFGYSEKPKWMALSGRTKQGCWRATSGQITLLTTVSNTRKLNGLMSDLTGTYDLLWAYDVMNEFYYSSDGVPTRHPDEDDYHAALEIIKVAAEKLK